MQKTMMLLETCDVPSAYLHASLPKGKKHVMRINPLIATYVCMADPEAKKFLQSDGSLLVQLERALYGLPESGKLWNELLEKLKSIGYVQMDGDSCI